MLQSLPERRYVGVSADLAIQKRAFCSLCLSASLWESRELVTSVCDSLGANMDKQSPGQGGLWGFLRSVLDTKMCLLLV